MTAQIATITHHDNGSELGLTVVTETSHLDMVLSYAWGDEPAQLHIVRWVDLSLEPAQEMILSVAEGQQLLACLSELDTRGELHAE